MVSSLEHMAGTRGRLIGLVITAAVLSCAGGCGKLLGPKEARPIASYPDGPAGLEAFFRDVLASAQADDREQVHALFQSLKMSRAELDRLFGARAAELAHPYDELMATLMHRGAVELVALVYEKKYDAVEVLPLTLPAPPDRLDLVALDRALVERPPLYSVRFKKRGEALGTRYDFFFYTGGKWRTGNQLGKVLAKREAELTPPPTAR